MKADKTTLVALSAVAVVLAVSSGMPSPGVATARLAAAQFPGGGFGRGAQPPQALVERFDKDADKRLNTAERQAAKQFVESQGRGGPGRGRGFGQTGGPVQAGPSVAKSSVKPVPASVPFYDLGTLRTMFIDFADADWEDQLMAFKDTDVEVPATVTIDGKSYKEIDFQFRGASSFMMVPEGRKHSFNVTVDGFDKKQDILGYTSLNLLNSHEDPSFLRSVLFLEIARNYLPAAKANFIRVVINGEHWGIYSNVQQVDKIFLQEWFKTKDGTRFKVPGSPGGRGGLEYFGPDVAQYKRVYEMKGKDDPKAWAALVNFTRVLNQTPVEQLETALAPILDIDGALRFLALDNALVNNDGYWVRASDYNIYLDTAGKFHILPHDTNETFATGGGRGFPGGPGGGRAGRPGGPGIPGGRDAAPPTGGFGGGGGRGGMRGGGPDLDPLVGLDDPSKPLRSKLLAVPTLRAKYLAYTRDIATKWLDWNALGPLVTKYQAMIASDVKADTRKLDSNEAFAASAKDLQSFAERRRALLLSATAR